MTEAFRKIFHSTDGMRVFRAPGRVNLIGEHTDYNLGFVLPVALDLATTIAAAPSSDGKLRIYSEHQCEMREWDAGDIGRLERAGHWSDYPIGVAQELVRAGYTIEPLNLLIRSSVPEGSGLSSSAALEVSAALALLRGRAIDPLELALLCQRAEVNFVGMPCGIMDQYVSLFGRENAAVEIDCRSLRHRYVDLPKGIAFVAVNSMVKHALGELGVSQAGGGMRGGGGNHRAAYSRCQESARRDAGAIGSGEGRSGGRDWPAGATRGDGERARGALRGSERDGRYRRDGAALCGIPPQPSARL